MAERKPCVLVVDDDKAICGLYRDILMNQCKIILAHSARQAVEQARRHPVSLVISDGMLPDGTGPEVCARLMKEGRVSRVIVVTGHLEEAKRQVAELGITAKGIYGKPIGMAALREAVRKALK
jgi:DNA-binding NtrC family response regulator